MYASSCVLEPDPYPSVKFSRHLNSSGVGWGESIHLPWVSEVVTAASVFRFQKQATGTRCELFFLPRRRGPSFPSRDGGCASSGLCGRCS